MGGDDSDHDGEVAGDLGIRVIEELGPCDVGELGGPRVAPADPASWLELAVGDELERCVGSSGLVPVSIVRRGCRSPISTALLSPSTYSRTASSLPRRATASFQQSSQVQPWRGSSGGTLRASRRGSRPLGDQRAGQALAWAAAALVSSGMPRRSKNSSLDSVGGGLGGPLALLQSPERSGGEAGEPLPERKLAVHPVEALGVGRVVPHDPVEVVRVQAVEVGTEGVDLDPQPQPVGLGDGPPVLPLLAGEFGVEVLELEPLGGETAVDECQAMLIAMQDRANSRLCLQV